MKILWTGSDTMYLVRYPPFIRFRFKVKIFVMRIVVRLMLPFVQEHYINHEILRKDLSRFGILKVKVNDWNKHNSNLGYPEPFEKRKHDGVNVYYYLPSGKNNTKFIEWLYGYDIIKKAIVLFPQYNWVRLDGTNDMSKEFPIMDFYVRPNRHDASSRLSRECEINSIQYYWSQENPDMEELCKRLNTL